MLELSMDEPDKLQKVAHALSSQLRIEILDLLKGRRMSVVDIAEELKLPPSTISLNVRVLEEVGLIITEVKKATRGTMKICLRSFDDVHMSLNKQEDYNNPKEYFELEMPIGQYMNCEVYPTCGIINSNGILDVEDKPYVFYHPDRMTAQLIWFRKGFVEYKFPLPQKNFKEIASIDFSVELCSETPNYNHEWPSDITVWINNIEIGTWTSPGDFGDRRGRLNPMWLPDNNTQYGLLKKWKVTNKGSFIDDEKVSTIQLSQLNMKGSDFVTIKIGVKESAKHCGGINLFGKGMGDYEQDILMRVIYE
ncbi:ArsR/SmtB family transcription factor [Metabacillus arenae]|uniref:Helix-turn-helix domain-containing protein n=1 Tax=Metabacillus arenae TaxID=2771434 RepID=A0A926NHT0_9BACI|nr:helix-turn-helix domain-containing protein [Metabacillus arenae]MBD1381894.1 helix-turn-helix domain-containing protein [Metabacillus arenae]